jgi:hypothetical protein
MVAAAAAAAAPASIATVQMEPTMTLAEVITKGRRRGKPMKSMGSCVALHPRPLLPWRCAHFVQPLDWLCDDIDVLLRSAARRRKARDKQRLASATSAADEAELEEAREAAEAAAVRPSLAPQVQFDPDTGRIIIDEGTLTHVRWARHASVP